jgi:hypothetical protein
MGNDITGSKTLGGSLTIDRASLKKVTKGFDGPECCFIDELLDQLEDDSKTVFEIQDLMWSGSRASSLFDFLVTKFLPLTKGSMDVVFYWDGGSDPTGLQIRYGEVTRCDVSMLLVPRLGVAARRVGL